MVEAGGYRVVIDYCHNVDGMRQLADFVNRMVTEAHGRSGRAIGIIGTPGDRRDQDQFDYGYLAASAFDEIIIREDKGLRGRNAGETAANVLAGVRAARSSAEGARTTHVETILEEGAAVHAAFRRAVPGDLVVVCADDPVSVYREAMALGSKALGGSAFADPGELGSALE
jgi:cyanophycin synthetase